MSYPIPSPEAPDAAQGFLYSASAPGYGPGVAEGYVQLLRQENSDFALDMGLRWDPSLTDGTAAPIPDYETSLEWSLDNGVYGSGLAPFFVAPQTFSPFSPVADPSRFSGGPGDPLHANIQKIGQGFALLGKAFGTALGTSVSIVTICQLIANAGLGPISALAAQVAAAITEGATTLVTGTTTLASFSGIVGPAAAPTMGFAVVLAALTAVASAYPAESPSLHQTKIPKNVEARIWYLEGGKLASNRFAGPEDERKVSDVFWKNRVPGFGRGNRARIENVDAETFFAGLVYLRASFEPPPSGFGHGTVNLLWTQRVSDAGIAAFRAARKTSPVSAAIRAAHALPSIPTQVEENMQAAVAKTDAGISLPYTQNYNALAYLAAAHERNESNVATYLASSEGKKLGAYAGDVGHAAGLATPTKIKPIILPRQLFNGAPMELNPALSDRLKQAFGRVSAEGETVISSPLARGAKTVGVVAVLGAVAGGLWWGAKKILHKR